MREQNATSSCYCNQVFCLFYPKVYMQRQGFNIVIDLDSNVTRMQDAFGTSWENSVEDAISEF